MPTSTTEIKMTDDVIEQDTYERVVAAIEFALRARKDPAKAALAALRPYFEKAARQAREEAWEQCAAIADNETSQEPIVAPGTNAAWDECARTIAAAIRALKAEAKVMTITHGFRRTIGGVSYAVDGCATARQARTEVFRMMLKDGWEPPKLREKWWQVWRPKEYEEGLREALPVEGE